MDGAVVTMVEQRVIQAGTHIVSGEIERYALVVEQQQSFAQIGMVDGEIEQAVADAVTETGATSMKDMGAVMKNAMAKFASQGMRVDGKVVSAAVKKELEGK